MHVYECLVKSGHMGSGRYLERVLQVRADSIFQAMQYAKSMPGVKKGGLRVSGASVLRVSMLR